MKDVFATWETCPNEFGIEKPDGVCMYVTKYEDGDFGFEVTDRVEDSVEVFFSKNAAIQMAKKILELAEAEDD